MNWIAHLHPIPALIYVMHELRTMKAIGRRLLANALWRDNMIYAGVSNAVRDDLRHHSRAFRKVISPRCIM